MSLIVDPANRQRTGDHRHWCWPPTDPIPEPWSRLAEIWWRLSVGAGVLSIIGGLVGLLAPQWIYGRETSALADAATAQDIVGVVVVAPLLLILGVRAVRGSFRSWLCWLGCLSFTAYNYLIYAFSIHFGPLFMVWVAVLALSLFALIGGLTTLPRSEALAQFAQAPVRFTGWFLIAVAVLFGLLWLSQIVPELLTGQPSSSAAEWNLPTNPVHVLDLAFFLPAVRHHRRLAVTSPLVRLGHRCRPAGFP